MLKELEGVTTSETAFIIDGEALALAEEEEELTGTRTGAGTVPFAMSFKQYPPFASFEHTVAVRGRKV